jgi:AbiV family abortive infection protein
MDFMAGFKDKPLDREQIVRGMYSCYLNAKNLLCEARLLKENGHPARALGLGILALEELGKIPLICNMLLVAKNNADIWKQFWRKFHFHQVKLRITSSYGKALLSSLGKKYKTEFPLGITTPLDKLKQLGFYVTLFAGEFVLPEDFAKDNPKMLDYVFAIADERITDWEPLHGSLESSGQFVDRSEDFFKELAAFGKEMKSFDEFKSKLPEWLRMMAKRKANGV